MMVFPEVLFVIINLNFPKDLIPRDTISNGTLVLQEWQPTKWRHYFSFKFIGNLGNDHH